MRFASFLGRFGLRTKFVVVISFLLITTVLSLSFYLNAKQAESYRRELESSSETMIRMLAISAEDGVIFENEFEK